jgi:hypothetical protein
VKQKKGATREIEIRDSKTRESLSAHMDAIVLSSCHGEVTAIMVARFKSSSHETLLSWLEKLKEKS